MANLSEETKWENGIYQLEIDDPLQGGADGIDNVQAKQLANHKSNISNPHNTTAAQVGAYSKAQTDRLLAAGAFDTSALVDESKAVNLLDLLGIRAVHSDTPATQAESLQVIPKLREWYAQHRFDGLKLCAYLDLALITVDGVTYTWNANYKNLRLMIMGFNTLLHCGDIEVVKPHIIFQFRNNVLEKRMNATDTNTGGYPASELREWLNDKFAAGLKAVLGDYLMEVPRLYSTKDSWGWYKDSVFIPTEPEVWGCSVWSEKTWNGFQGHWPAYREGTVYKVKTLNGSRKEWWEASPLSENTSCFCDCSADGDAGYYIAAGWAGGVAPAICVALSDTQS